MTTITEHTVKTDRHTTAYLAAGPEDGPLVVFVHGWPELAISWRHQLPALAALGFRAIAPDMRGYGRSSVPKAHEDYALELIVTDMLELLDALGADRAVWVGHDWGCPVVWSIASHHPDRVQAVANLCVPYFSLERGLDACIPLLDRSVYPEDKFPAGQWEYQLYYQEHFLKATASMESDTYNLARLLFRKGDPAGRGQPSATAMTRIMGGWFGGGGPPDAPRDDDVVSEPELCAYAAALARNGMFGANSYYMNHAANASYAERAVNDGYLDMPVLFLAARYDFTCECIDSDLAVPMRGYCRNLTEAVIDSGHWMAQERGTEVNRALVHWLATSVEGVWR
jgi:pimeloyl-ACP methyl ester carboxylesterase